MKAWIRYWLPVMTVWLTVSWRPTIATSPPTCDRPTLDRAVQQLAEQSQRSAAQTALKQCGEAAVPPLTLALNAETAATRRYAAQTLGELGWTATSGVSPLVRVSQGDGDREVRGSAVRALRAIGEAGAQESDKQAETAWATKAKDLENLTLTQNELQTRWEDLTGRSSYQVVIWMQGHPGVVGASGLHSGSPDLVQ